MGLEPLSLWTFPLLLLLLLPNSPSGSWNPKANATNAISRRSLQMTLLLLTILYRALVIIRERMVRSVLNGLSVLLLSLTLRVV